MEIDGHCYVHSVVKIEIEKVRGIYSDFVRIKIKGEGSETHDVLSFACWGVRVDALDRPRQPEVIIVTITETDEREPADAISEHDEESDR